MQIFVEVRSNKFNPLINDHFLVAKNASAKKLTIEAESSDTLADVKLQIQAQEGIDPKFIKTVKLELKGIALSEESTLGDNNVEEADTLVFPLPRGAR